MENKYIREFVEHYKALGFDKICLYDNNDKNGERYDAVIKDYITSGFVIVKNIRGHANAQVACYTKCYNEYKKKFDWIGFFDIDEFLHIDKGFNIKQFLSQYMYNHDNVNCIRVCWKQFTDSDIIQTNGNYSVKKFKAHLPITHVDSSQTKIIIKTTIDNLVFTSPHGALTNNNVKCVNTKGKFCENAIMVKHPTWANACLHHYRFKTLEEFIKNKMVRLWPTTYKNGGKSFLTVDTFFKYNKKTPEKVKYANMLLQKLFKK